MKPQTDCGLRLPNLMPCLYMMVTRITSTAEEGSCENRRFFRDWRSCGTRGIPGGKKNVAASPRTTSPLHRAVSPSGDRGSHLAGRRSRDHADAADGRAPYDRPRLL